MAIGQQIKKRREELGLTQEELAKKIGYKSKSTINKIELGINDIPQKRIVDFANALDTTVAELMEWVDHPHIIFHPSINLKQATEKDLNDALIKIYESDTSSNDNTSFITTAVRIPVFARVAAGIPFEAIEDIIDWEEITPEMAADGKYFGLCICGDSMEPRICNGDVVIVRKQDDADDGDIVIALVNGNDAVCKRLRKYENGMVALISTNPAYDPMYFSKGEVDETPVRIIGKVKELRGKF